VSKYYLKLKDEKINKVDAGSWELALEYFCKVKRLPKDKLLEIFNIEKEKDGDRN
jgi:hypothetical protein